MSDKVFEMELLRNEKHQNNSSHEEYMAGIKSKLEELERAKKELEELEEHKKSKPVDLNISGDVLMEKLSRKTNNRTDNDIFSKVKNFAERINNTEYSAEYDELQVEDELIALTKELISVADFRNENKVIESIVLLSQIKDPALPNGDKITASSDEFCYLIVDYLTPIKIINYQIDKGIISKDSEITLNKRKTKVKNVIKFFDRVEQIKLSMIDSFISTGELNDGTEASDNENVGFEFMKFLIEQRD